MPAPLGEVLDVLVMRATGEQQRETGVMEVVEADGGQARLLEQRLLVAGHDVLGVEGWPVSGGEHEAPIPVQGIGRLAATYARNGRGILGRIFRASTASARGDWRTAGGVRPSYMPAFVRSAPLPWPYRDNIAGAVEPGKSSLLSRLRRVASEFTR